MEKTVAWFIEPLNAQTNEIIARRLAELSEISDSTSQITLDDKGIERSVYQVKNHKRLAEFYKSKTQFQLKFNVYTRIGIDAPLKESLIDTEEFRRAKKQKKIIGKTGYKKASVN